MHIEKTYCKIIIAMFRKKLIMFDVFDQMVANVTECDFSSNEVLTKCIKELTEEQLINATKKVGAENLKGDAFQ